MLLARRAATATKRAGVHRPRSSGDRLNTKRAFAMDRVEFGSRGAYGYEAGAKKGKGATPAPAGIIVLQEWWGINDTIKELALLVADAGPYHVLVPDLYKGKLGVDAEEASHLMGSLDFKAAVADVADAAAYLRACGARRVGCVGFCMGGALTLAAAQHAGVDAAVPFYGVPDPAICDPAAIKVPVQAHFGALDTLAGFSDPAAAEALAAKMSGDVLEMHMWPGCGHAFMNALTPTGLALLKANGSPEPAQGEVREAWQLLVAFFEQRLLQHE